MVQQGATGKATLQPQQFATGGYGGPHEVGGIRRSLPPLPLLAHQRTARDVVDGALHDHGVGLVSKHGAQHGLGGGGNDDNGDEEEEEEDEDAPSGESIPVSVPTDATLTKRSWCCSRKKTPTALCRRFLRRWHCHIDNGMADLSDDRFTCCFCDTKMKSGCHCHA